MRKLQILALAVLFIATSLLHSETITVTDADIQPGDNVTWTSNNEYILDGFVFVDAGATLTIQAGTVIKGMEGTGADASALIVTRGAQIFAEGTADNPIIFTSEFDDVTNPNDLTKDDRGLWGGLIVLGSSTINVSGGTEQIEGIPVEEPRGNYGGNNEEDNSGVLRYISIRHGGSNIGQDNEINGLTLGAVGTGTTVEYIEIFANADDGFEWFGGTVNTKYLVAAFCGDDGYDYDEGFRGKGQFWFLIQDEVVAGSAGEHDGGTSPEDGQPYAQPEIYNVTYIGPGQNSIISDPFVNMRDNAGGKYYSSIFMDATASALLIEDLDVAGEDSRKRMEAGQLEFANNMFFNFGGGIATQDFVTTHINNNNNRTNVDPQLMGISRTTDGGLDPRLMPNSPAKSGAKVAPNDGFYTPVSYVGAFGNTLWITNWTFIDEAGYVTENSNQVTVTDADIQPGDNVVWTADNEYTLDGFVFVEDGATLTIEPGTVIKGKEGTGADASALIIARGGQIFAEGTPTSPIIFTSEFDDVTNPNDLTKDDRGLWGGLIVLGSSTINVSGGTEQIEGIPVEEPRGNYGGNNEEDNSGVLRYISIRHGGSNIGQDNEINGLTMGAVGSGTTIEYIEIFANADDGFEWFGGTANTKYLVAAFCGDDGYDYDEGFRGKGQFWFLIQDEVVAGSAGEHDGGTSPEDGQPYAQPIIYNVTYIGPGQNSIVSDPFVNMRDNAGGHYYSSIFTDATGEALLIEDLDVAGEDSRKRMEADQLVFANNIFYNFGGGVSSQDFVNSHLADNNNRLNTDPMLMGISRATDGGLDPRPMPNSPAYTDAKVAPNDGFFCPVDYVGAFDENLWVTGWTFIYQSGFVRQRGTNQITVLDSDIQPGDDVVWTADNEYTLDGFVFVEAGATLTIEPGTVIKAKTGTGADASALIIARGGQIFAEGTPSNPIIFTSEFDDVNNPNDLTKDDRGLWGGLIVLGSSTINVSGGTEQIEGIPVEEPRGNYGGTNDEHNAGVLRYISIRHGGSNIGQDNEINGLTLGAVGTGTTVEFIEIFANADDGFEWFGGTVNTRYLVAAYCGDDGFDYDEGFRGKGQFWFLIQDPLIAGSAGEHDGGTSPEDGEPYAEPVIYNATYIGPGTNSPISDPFINMRDNAGGHYHTSIFMDASAAALLIEDLDVDGEDSRKRMEAGQLEFTDNHFYNFGGGVTTQNFVTTHINNNNNTTDVDPEIMGVSRTRDRMLDPRLSMSSPAWGTNRIAPNDGFFTQADYAGAFGDGNWASDWTFIGEAGFLSAKGAFNPILSEVSSVEEYFVEDETANVNNPVRVFPNPVETSTKLEITIQEYSNVQISVYNSLGVKVATLVNTTLPQGNFGYNWTPEGLNAGVYFINVNTEYGNFTQKVVIR